jgi:hypothetical protein
VNLKAIIASLPMLRRAWKFLPGPLRVPVLVIAAIIGIVQFVTGRRANKDDAGDRDGPPPPPRGGS